MYRYNVIIFVSDKETRLFANDHVRTERLYSTYNTLRKLIDYKLLA